MELFWFSWVLFSIFIGFFADSRGRIGPAWFLISLFTSPLFSFALLLVIKNLVEENKKEQERKEDKEMQMKQLDALVKKSLADELLKLAELKEKGIISDQEFNKFKTSILLS